jgi:hypothetical protein
MIHRQKTIRHKDRLGVTRAETHKLVFVWKEGSPNININFPGHVGHDLIKVYDYAKGGVTIQTKDQMRAEVNEYMKALTDHDLRAFRDNARPL